MSTNSYKFYKIVESCENGKKLLSIVPCIWEHNGKVMRPPETKRENAFQKPWNPPGSLDDGWTQHRCVLKRSFIPTYNQALAEMRLISDDSDTIDVELSQPHAPLTIRKQTAGGQKVVSAVVNTDSQRTNLSNGQHKNTNYYEDGSSSLSLNSNDYSEYLQQAQNEIKEQQELVQQQLQQGKPQNGHMFVVGNDGKLIVIPVKSESKHGTNLEGMIVTLASAVSKLEARLEHSIALQQQILSKIAMGTQLDTTPPDQEYFEPIDNIEQLTTLEANLSKREFFDELYHKLSSICSPNCGQTGDNVSYRIVDSLFSRKLFTLVSWSGVSRCKENENFSRFVNAFKLFHSLVKRCDSSYSKTSLKSFFQKIINNSRRRYETSISNKAKRISATKHSSKIKRKRTNYTVNRRKSSQMVKDRESYNYNSNNDDVSTQNDGASEAEEIDLTASNRCIKTESEDDDQSMEIVPATEKTLDWIKSENPFICTNEI